MRIQARLALAILLAGNLLSAAWADDAKFSAPNKYTLALGDSLAFGFQLAKFSGNPYDLAQYHTGFAFVFTARVAETSPGKRAELRNLACPAESTITFLSGQCPYHTFLPPTLPPAQLHYPYTGSQMDAAEEFLLANRGKVSPILISLGANDLLALLAFCPTAEPQCIGAILPGILATAGQNLSYILGRLRSAAPDAEILLLQLYNPLELAFPGTNFVTTSLNAVIGDVAAAHRARVANAFPAFNLPEPAGNLCTLTLICTAGDIHASDAGYQMISDLMFEAAGYTRFEH